MKPGYFPGIQDLRGWAALSVVFYHAHVLFQKEKYFGTQLFGGFFEFGHRGVDLFFVISGFLMAMLSHDPTRQLRPAKFLAARARRIYIPYLPVFLALSAACFLVPGVCPAAYRFDIGTFLANVFILPRQDADTYVPVVAWTLSHELFFYLMTFISLLLGRAGALFLGIWLAASLAATLLVAQMPFPLSFFFSPYNLAFGLGFLAFHLHRHRGGAIPYRLALATGTVAFLGLGAVEAFGLLPTTGREGTALTLGFFVASFLLLLGFTGISSGRVSAMGNASYSIYLVHYPVLVVLCMLARRMLEGAVPLYALYFLVLGGSLLAGGLYYLVVERPGLRLFGRKAAP